MKYWGKELIINLYNCNHDYISSQIRIESFAIALCKIINVRPYGDPITHRFGKPRSKNYGYSLIQLIETSSITGHFSEKNNTAYINIFSCKDFNGKTVEEYVKEYFLATRMETFLLNRK